MSPKECFQGCNKILSGLKQIFVRIWPKKCLPLQQEFSFLQFLVQSDIFWRPIFPKIFRGICPLAPVRSAAQRRIYWGGSVPPNSSSNPSQRNLQPLPEEPPTPIKNPTPQKCFVPPTEGTIFQNFSPAASFYSILITKMSSLILLNGSFFKIFRLRRAMLVSFIENFSTLLAWPQIPLAENVHIRP